MDNYQVMDSKDTISGSLGRVFYTLGDRRYLGMEFVKVEAKVEKTKKEVPILGKTGKGNKSTGWKGTGTATLHYITSHFRHYLFEYMKTGKDFYFDMQIVNDDPTSDVGRQTTILKHCNINSAIIAKVDADAEDLDEDFDFTFDDAEFPEEFSDLAGM